MSSAPVASHISQSPDIIPQLPLRIVLNRQSRQLSRDLGHGALWNISNLGEWVDGELGQNAGGGLGTQSVERLEGCLEQLLLREVDAEDEDLVVC